MGHMHTARVEVRASHLLVKHKDVRRPSSWKEKTITRSKVRVMGRCGGCVYVWDMGYIVGILVSPVAMYLAVLVCCFALDVLVSCPPMAPHLCTLTKPTAQTKPTS